MRTFAAKWFALSSEREKQKLAFISERTPIAVASVVRHDPCLFAQNYLDFGHSFAYIV